MSRLLQHVVAGRCEDPDCEVHNPDVGLLETVVTEDQLAFFIAGMDRGMNLDHLSLYEKLATIIPREEFLRLGQAWELCPVHFCDINICLDDGEHGDEVYAIESTAL